MENVVANHTSHFKYDSFLTQTDTQTDRYTTETGGCKGRKIKMIQEYQQI
jgi:hypothetical protein